MSVIQRVIRETYADRKNREAVRDRIRELGLLSAEHTAQADMIGVKRTSEDHPRVRFSPAPSPNRCACGAPMTPLPRPHKRFGWLQTWYCPYCGLENLIKAALRIHEAASGATR